MHKTWWLGPLVAISIALLGVAASWGSSKVETAFLEKQLTENEMADKEHVDKDEIKHDNLIKHLYEHDIQFGQQTVLLQQMDKTLIEIQRDIKALRQSRIYDGH